MAVLDDLLALLQRCETTSAIGDDAAGAEQQQKGEARLLQELAATKRALLLKCDATRDPRWLVALCHVVNQFAMRLVVAAPRSTAEAARINKCVFLLENAITTSLRSLQRMTQLATVTRADDDDDDSAMEIDAGTDSEQSLKYEEGSRVLLQSSYRRLFERVLASFGDNESSRSVAAAILSRLGLLLAICWLTVNRSTLLYNAIDLLSIAAQCCERYRDARSSAKWPLFLLGLLHLVEKRDSEQALQYFQSAAMLQDTSTSSSSSNSPDQDGAFHYWYGVALFKRGHVVQATDQLQRCLRCNYAPVASLNLSALAHLRGSNRDFHASSLELQRALEIDFLESITMFNYAALLGNMRNFAAQQQMLEYYQEAMHPEGSAAVERKRVRSGMPQAKQDNATKTYGAPPSAGELFAEVQLAALFAPNASHVTPAMLRSQLAYAAMENGDWEQAKQCFEEFLARESSDTADVRTEVCRDYIYVLLQSHLHSLALETCDRVLASTQESSSDRVIEALLLIHLYKADALLSLQRVLECHQYLKQTVVPALNKLLPQSQPLQQHPNKRGKDQVTSESSSEIAACHAQLINNLAVVTACQDDDNGVNAAIVMLRNGMHLYPQALSLKFNLVLLLWRKQQKEAACSIWFEARGWSLHMDMRDIGDERKAIEMVASAEEAAILAAASPHLQIAEHVRSSDDGDGVVRQQLLYLDALVLNHWGKIQNSREIETSVNYIQYLDSLSSSSKRAARNKNSDNYNERL